MATDDQASLEVTVHDTTSRRLWRLTSTPKVEDGAGVLFLEGRLGHAVAAELKATADRLIGAGTSDLTIDLAGVDYLSSGALRVIAQLGADLAGRGGRLTLRRPSIPARVALELSGLWTFVASIRPAD